MTIPLPKGLCLQLGGGLPRVQLAITSNTASSPWVWPGPRTEYDADTARKGDISVSLLLTLVLEACRLSGAAGVLERWRCRAGSLEQAAPPAASLLVTTAALELREVGGASPWRKQRPPGYPCGLQVPNPTPTKGTTCDIMPLWAYT